jgi:hypothetical protein
VTGVKNTRLIGISGAKKKFVPMQMLISVQDRLPAYDAISTHDVIAASVILGNLGDT